jgi:hypothetical protein
VKLVALIFFSLTFVFCNTGYRGGDDVIAGKYRTVVFIQPGPADQPVKLHEKGGYVEFNFNEDSTFEAKFFIPSLPDLQMEKTEMNFKGKYSVKGNTVKISDTNIFLDTELFVYKDGKLEIKNKLPGLMDLVLEKVEE